MKRQMILGAVALVALSMGCKAKSGGDMQTPEQAAIPCGPEALIDDGEDMNNQVLVQDGRGGYWYTFVDEGGSTVSPEAGSKGGTFTMAEGGANGSAFAARFSGRVGSGGIVYVGMGMNFVDPKDAYDASRYGGIAFYAQGDSSVRIKVPDASTDPQGGVCKECFNDFGVAINLTGSWTKYVIPYSVMRQEEGWGTPRVGSITPAQLYGIQWQVNTPGKSFNVSVDDVGFTGCGQTAAPAAEAAPPAAEAAPAEPAVQ